MAQLWHFMGRVGVPVVYTWPAGHPGLLRGYQYDRESGEFTVFHLRQALELLADCPDVEKIHIIAHSRGTDIAMSALRELHIGARAAGLDTRERYKLGTVVLAAAANAQDHGSNSIVLIQSSDLHAGKTIPSDVRFVASGQPDASMLQAVCTFFQSSGERLKPTR